jgi:hypothetical protein
MTYYNPRLNYIGMSINNTVLVQISDYEYMVLTDEWLKL